MKGYKAFNKDLQCRGMQYEIGGTYELEDTPICCERGFHFCKSISDCYSFYDRSDETRICEVEALGDVVTNDDVKYCTNKIIVVREVENPKAKTNVNKNCTGFCNSGDYNTGDYNSGNFNNGDRNSGDFNSGSWNSGEYNSGDYNSGYCNSGSWNSGDYNSGHWNTGDCNSGSRNSGNRNAGNWNSGNFNSGVWNSGDWNAGIFNTEQMPTIKIFDKDSDWTMKDWYNSIACRIMSSCPATHSTFVYEENMSEEEKENHPEYITLGGYTKVITVTAEDKQKWWDNLSDDDKQVVMSLPNFDKEKFKKCTEIEA
jgi:hypothetical protein